MVSVHCYDTKETKEGSQHRVSDGVMSAELLNKHKKKFTTSAMIRRTITQWLVLSGL